MTVYSNTNYKSLKKKVEYVLLNHEPARNSDVELTIKIWKVFYSERLTRNLKTGELSGVTFKTLFDLPREDNVKRVRATIQNTEKRYLPTSLKVALKRKISEDVWRAAMGYPLKHNFNNGKLF